MKCYRFVAVLFIVFALLLLKVAFPGLVPALRKALHIDGNGESEAISAFRELGQRLSLRTADAAEPVAAEPPAAQAQYISYRIEEGSTGGDAAPETSASEPPAVAAFLESQAAFADQPLPENVNYAYLPLPFACASPVSGYNSSGFGFRLHPILNVVRFHYGTDFAAGAGEPVTAFADGTVVFVGSDDSYGKHVKVDHGGGWVSHYCHCSALLVSEGTQVIKSQQIALVGATGLATGPHLHFELSCNGVFVNPEYYLNV